MQRSSRVEDKVRVVASVDQIRKRVTDDPFELMAVVGLVTPLVTGECQSPSAPQLLMRRVLSRHVVLVLTRLHAKPGTGRSGVTASIETLLKALAKSSLLPAGKIDGFRARREQLLSAMEDDGVAEADVNLFRNVDLAHSLLAHDPPKTDISWPAVNAFAEGTNALVRDIETEIVRSGGRSMPVLGPEECLQWVDHGRLLWGVRRT